MTIYINGEAIQVAEGITLGQMLQELQVPTTGVAVAVDGKVVPRQDREEYILHSESAIIIIKAACGG